MTKTYQITAKNHLKAGKFIVIHLVFLFLFEAFVIYILEDAFIAKAAFGIYSIIIFPAIFLHLEYYLMDNKKIIIEMDKSLEILENGEVTHLNNENVLELRLYMSATMRNYGAVGPLPWENYNYAEIKTKDKIIIITNLLYPSLRSLPAKFPGTKPLYQETIFATR